MPVYTYGRIARLHACLLSSGTAPQIVELIMKGGEAIVPASKPEAKASWMRDAMLRMEALLEPSVRQAVREKCACCLRGRRLKTAQSIALSRDSLDARIQALDQSGIAGRVRRLDDRRISSSFSEGPGPYRCRCLPEAREPMPVTYCQCCGGQIKHHMQIALGRRLSVEVKSSALSSGGKKPCVFHLTIEE